MAALTEIFIDTPDSCNQILNSNTFMHVVAFPCGSDDPASIEITVDTALVGGEEAIVLSTTEPNGVKLRKNSVLNFVTAGEIVVTSTTLVTTGTSVPIEAAPGAVADTDTATVWGMLSVLSPTNIPLNIEASEVDRTDLTFALQGSMVKAKIEVNNQINTIGRKDDEALYSLIFNRCFNDTRLYVVFEYSDDTHAFGPAEFVGWTRDGNVSEITRPQFTCKLQAPFAIAEPYQYLSTTKQTALNNMRSLAGLPQLS